MPQNKSKYLTSYQPLCTLIFQYLLLATWYLLPMVKFTICYHVRNDIKTTSNKLIIFVAIKSIFVINVFSFCKCFPGLIDALPLPVLELS